MLLINMGLNIHGSDALAYFKIIHDALENIFGVYVCQKK